MSLRVLHCPNVVGGNAPALSRAQRALGAQTWCVTFNPSPYGYAADEELFPGRGWLRREFARWKLIRRALLEFDVIHYNFGSPLAPRRKLSASRRRAGSLASRLYNLLYAIPFEFCDVRWAQKRGKVVAVTYQGDDARQGDVARRYPIHFAHEVDADYYSPEGDEAARRNVAHFARHADLIYALNPDLLSVLPAQAQFQAYCSVDASEWDSRARTFDLMRPPRIIHAPSNRAVKGTKYIVEAIEALRASGVEIDFALVENLTNAEARRLYETADLAIDQVLAGFYGAMAVELMALRVPVICYLRDEDLHVLPREMRTALPLINATPSTLREVLRSWLTGRRDELRSRGEQSREFVQRWHNPREIAAATLRDYQLALAHKCGTAVTARTPSAARVG
jgi:glycosyltransferase involved in cell wall biosynthesis